MGNYKFYTPPLLADCLIKQLPKQEYHNVIDICCGSWNLLTAAKKRFEEADYTGVDIDEDAVKDCFIDAKFICVDGRRFANKERIKYDLILSNPPFGCLQEKERFFKNTNKGIIKELNNKRYENEMMQANLLLSDKGGVLLFIMPATFFEGDTYLIIRKSICKKFTVESVIKLPIETFGSGRISAYALIMRNTGKQCARASLKEAIYLKNKWKIKHRKYISVQRMLSGHWISKVTKQINIKEIEIFRGNISTAEMSETGNLVLHSSSKLANGNWYPSARYCNDNEKIKKARKVQPGDIIVNRVGRFARYWCVCREEALVSDCLIVIRSDEISKIYIKLENHTIEGQLDIPTKGVAIRYITIKDIRGLL